MTAITALYYQTIAGMLLTVVWMAVHAMYRCLTHLNAEALPVVSGEALARAIVRPAYRAPIGGSR